MHMPTSRTVATPHSTQSRIWPPQTRSPAFKCRQCHCRPRANRQRHDQSSALRSIATINNCHTALPCFKLRVCFQNLSFCSLHYHCFLAYNAAANRLHIRFSACALRCAVLCRLSKILPCSGRNTRPICRQHQPAMDHQTVMGRGLAQGHGRSAPPAWSPCSYWSKRSVRV